MNQNQMNMMGNGYPMPAQNVPKKGFKFPDNGKPIFIAYLVCLAITVVGLFLPYAVCEAADISINYIYAADQIKDGVFILGFTVAAILLAFNAKYIGSVIFQVLSIGIFAIDMVNSLDTFKDFNNTYGVLGDAFKYKFGIGFYSVLIALLGALVTSILVFIQNKSNNPAPAAVMPQPMPQQPVNQMPVQQPVQPQVSNNCPYCGTPKTSDSPFCPNCGAKM